MFFGTGKQLLGAERKFIQTSGTLRLTIRISSWIWELILFCDYSFTVILKQWHIAKEILTSIVELLFYKMNHHRHLKQQ